MALIDAELERHVAKLWVCRLQISFGGVMYLLAAGAACGIAMHRALMQNLGVVPTSWFAVGLMVLVASVCTFLAVRSMQGVKAAAA